MRTMLPELVLTMGPRRYRVRSQRGAILHDDGFAMLIRGGAGVKGMAIEGRVRPCETREA